MSITNDNIGQLKIANSSVNTEDRGYTYDTAWNLNYRTNNGVLATFKVDPQNQLTNAPGFSRQTYDGNGNLVQGYASGPDRLYTYDDENRLTAVEREDVWRTEFIYDGTGRLRVRQEYDFTDDWELASETHYLYDGMRVIQERDASNVPTVSYTRGTDLSGSLEGAGGIGGLLARTANSQLPSPNAHAFYHADGNGNITYLVNSSQTVAASYRYDPFGNTLSSSGSLAADNAYRFSSKEVHANSGLYYYGYRFYDANGQRWLNRDPIEENGFDFLRYRNRNLLGLIDILRKPGDNNLYGFLRNQPTDLFDAFGLAPGTSPTGPDSIACARAREQLEAAVELARSEPSAENQLAVVYAVANALAACRPPPPKPPQPTSCPPEPPKRPWWKRIRIPFPFPIIIIPNPCWFDPYLPGCPPVTA